MHSGHEPMGLSRHKVGGTRLLYTGGAESVVLSMRLPALTLRLSLSHAQKLPVYKRDTKVSSPPACTAAYTLEGGRFVPPVFFTKTSVPLFLLLCHSSSPLTLPPMHFILHPFSSLFSLHSFRRPCPPLPCPLHPSASVPTMLMPLLLDTGSPTLPRRRWRPSLLS
jgi:hypothetical protein